MTVDIYPLGVLVLIGIGLILACYTILGVVAFRHGCADTFSQLLGRSGALKVITVGWIIIATTFLGLAGVFKEAAVVAILSGTAGYVLGGAEKTKNRRGELHLGDDAASSEERRLESKK
jgi:hypothetical protein